MNRAACIDCEYAETLTSPKGLLRCHRYAPRPGAGGVELASVVWPLVNPEDWCGEYLEREPEDHDL